MCIDKMGMQYTSASCHDHKRNHASSLIFTRLYRCSLGTCPAYAMRYTALNEIRMPSILFFRCLPLPCFSWSLDFLRSYRWPSQSHALMDDTCIIDSLSHKLWMMIRWLKHEVTLKNYVFILHLEMIKCCSWILVVEIHQQTVGIWHSVAFKHASLTAWHWTLS